MIMNTKQCYTAPECAPITVCECMPLCTSGNLDPIQDNTDVIDWTIL
jgi:hypothetical protein